MYQPADLGVKAPNHPSISVELWAWKSTDLKARLQKEVLLMKETDSPTYVKNKPIIYMVAWSL